LILYLFWAIVNNVSVQLGWVSPNFFLVPNNQLAQQPCEAYTNQMELTGC
jgi:hypothetical protein